MKTIHYDAEGDILSVTFADAESEQTGVELSDNIVLYYNPATEEPLQLILVSYQAMLAANEHQPILLDGLARMPIQIQQTIKGVLGRTPLTAFLQLEAQPSASALLGRLGKVFTPAAVDAVAA